MNDKTIEENLVGEKELKLFTTTTTKVLVILELWLLKEQMANYMPLLKRYNQM